MGKTTVVVEVSGSYAEFVEEGDVDVILVNHNHLDDSTDDEDLCFVKDTIAILGTYKQNGNVKAIIENLLLLERRIKANIKRENKRLARTA